MSQQDQTQALQSPKQEITQPENTRYISVTQKFNKDAIERAKPVIAFGAKKTRKPSVKNADDPNVKIMLDVKPK